MIMATRTLHVGYAVACLVPMGRLEEALSEFRRALELDPESYLANVGEAYALLSAGRYQEAIGRYQKAAEINPTHGDTQWDLGMAYALAGQKEPAIRQFRLGGQIHAGTDWDLGATEYALLGDFETAKKKLNEWLARTEPKPRYMFLAYCYGVLGDADGAAAALEKAYAARDPQIIWIKIDPRLGKVRGNPRIEAIIHKVGL
jgi:adenylate cyclase